MLAHAFCTAQIHAPCQAMFVVLTKRDFFVYKICNLYRDRIGFFWRRRPLGQCFPSVQVSDSVLITGAVMACAAESKMSTACMQSRFMTRVFEALLEQHKIINSFHCRHRLMTKEIT